MSTNEFRIGNYVEAGGVIVSIVALSGNEPAKIKVMSFRNNSFEIGISELLPIALSHELLARCCSFDITGKHRIGIDHDRYYLQIDDGYIILANRDNEAMIHFWDIRHLHQLQNLYFALKGKEMPVLL